LRFGTNIVINKNKNEVVGIIDKNKKKKTNSVDWLPESKNLYRFITENGQNIYYLPETETRNPPSIVRYRDQLMYAVPECDDSNNEETSVDLTDWFSIPDLPTLKKTNQTKARRFRLYAIHR
jgi:hypothetical protein